MSYNREIDTASIPIHPENEKGISGNAPNKTRRYQRSVSRCSEDSTESEEEMNVMEEIEKAFEKAIDCKFAQIEQRIIQMEEKSEKVYKIVSKKGDNDKCSEESLYRGLMDLIEHNNEYSKQCAKTLDALNAKQNALIENTEDLITKTSKLQKAVNNPQKHSPANVFDETSSSSSDQSIAKHSNPEILKRTNKIYSGVETIHEKMDSWVQYSKENTNRMLEKLTSMAKAVEGTTLQEKVMHDSMFQKMDIICDTLDKNMFPLTNDTNKAQKQTVGGKELKELFEKLHVAITDRKANEQTISNDQNLENLANIVECLTTLKQETASLQYGINEILNNKLSEEFLRGVVNAIKAQDNKPIMQNDVADKKCEPSMKELLQEIKKVHTSFDEVVSDIKNFGTERVDEAKIILQRISKAQTKLSNKKETSPKKKTNAGSDNASVHSMLLQMEIRKASAEQTKLLNVVNSTIQEMSENQTKHHHWMANFRSSVSTDIGTLIKNCLSGNNYEDKWNTFENNMQSVFLQQSNNILEEFNKSSNVHSEILNSIEDLKILTSSMSNTFNDLVPLIKKMEEDIATFPDDVNGCFAGLEENLCANLEGRIKDINDSNLQEICKHFDSLEKRLLVIRKYVKYGGYGNQESVPNDSSDCAKILGTPPSNNQLISSIFDRVDAIGCTVENNLLSNETIKKEIDNLGKSVPSISDITKYFSKERLSMADQISKHVSTNCKDSFDLPLNAIRDLQYQILEKQAKADVVEEQFLALADEIMPSIKELKSIEDSLVSFCEKSLEPINQHVNVKVATGSNKNEDVDIILAITHMEERLMVNQNESLILLQETVLSNKGCTNGCSSVIGNTKAIKLVVQLNSLMKHVEESQQDILKQGNNTIEHQVMMNKRFQKIVPILNNIQKMLTNNFGVVETLNIDGILKGCKQLYKKINDIDALATQLTTSALNDGRSDLQHLIQNSIALLNNIDGVISLEELRTENNECFKSDIDKASKPDGSIDKPTNKWEPRLSNLKGKQVSNLNPKADNVTPEKESVLHISDVKRLRLEKSNTPEGYLTSNASKGKIANSPLNKITILPCTARKRTSSSSADESIVDTNSEAQKQVKGIGESIPAQALSVKKLMGTVKEDHGVRKEKDLAFLSNLM